MSKVSQETGEIIKPYECKPRAARSTFTPLGDQFYRKAKLSVGPNGEQIAEPGDVVDLQAYIQASKASTDMASIIARYNAGDESVLNVTPNGFYGDVSIIPSTVNDFEKINKLGEIAADKFAALPKEVQEAFGNDSNAFLNAIMANKVDEILNNYASEKQASQVEEK